MQKEHKKSFVVRKRSRIGHSPLTTAPTLEDRSDDREVQNQALQDQLSALSDDLNDTRAGLADVKRSADGKMDAMIGYIILIMVLVTLVVCVIPLVRKK